MASDDDDDDVTTWEGMAPFTSAPSTTTKSAKRKRSVEADTWNSDDTSSESRGSQIITTTTTTTTAVLTVDTGVDAACSLCRDLSPAAHGVNRNFAPRASPQTLTWRQSQPTDVRTEMRAWCLDLTNSRYLPGAVGNVLRNGTFLFEFDDGDIQVPCTISMLRDRNPDPEPWNGALTLS